MSGTRTFCAINKSYDTAGQTGKEPETNFRQRNAKTEQTSLKGSTENTKHTPEVVKYSQEELQSLQSEVANLRVSQVDEKHVQDEQIINNSGFASKSPFASSSALNETALQPEALEQKTNIQESSTIDYDLDALNNLTDLFPAVPRSELIARLRSSEDIEEIVELLFKEQEPQNHVTEVHLLHEIFPQNSLRELQLELAAHGGDMEAASGAILLNKWKYKCKKGKPETERSSWSTLSEDAEALSKLTDLPTSTTSTYLHKCQGKVANALILIVRQHKETEQPTSNIPRGGRVQRGGAKISTNEIHSVLKRPYRFNSQSQEALELRTIVLANLSLSLIDEAFVNDALTFQKGNVDKTVELLMALLQLGTHLLTYLSTKRLTGSGTQQTKNQKSAAGLFTQSSLRMNNFSAAAGTNADSQCKTQLFTPSKPSNEVERLMNDRIQTAFSTNRLDLHGLQVDHATRATKEATSKWWHQEEQLRENHGHMSRYGTAAQFCDPLMVITGKGIHSSNGRSQVRVQVGRLLDKQNFAYDDNGGSYTVYGKRK